MNPVSIGTKSHCPVQPVLPVVILMKVPAPVHCVRKEHIQIALVPHIVSIVRQVQQLLSSGQQVPKNVMSVLQVIFGTRHRKNV